MPGQLRGQPGGRARQRSHPWPVPAHSVLLLLYAGRVRPQRLRLRDPAVPAGLLCPAVRAGVCGVPRPVLYLWRAHHALSDPGHRGAGHLHPPPAGRTAGYPGLCLGPVRHVHGPSLPRPAGAGDGGRRLQLRPVYLHHRGLLPVCHHRAAERAAGAPGRPAHPAQRPVRARRRPRPPDPAV